MLKAKNSQAGSQSKLKGFQELETHLESYKSEIQGLKALSQKQGIKISDLQASREDQLKKDSQVKEELASYQKMVADLNREKVNLMRDMTLLHDKWKSEQNDSNKYKTIAKESQNELERVQSQVDTLYQALEQKEICETKTRQTKGNKKGLGYELNMSHSRTSSQTTTAHNKSSILNTTNNKSSKISGKSGENKSKVNQIVNESQISDNVDMTIDGETDDDINEKIKLIRAKYDI